VVLDRSNIHIAQVETKLVSEVEAHKTNPTKSAAADIEKTWDIDVDIDSTLLDPAFQGEQFDFSFLNPQSSTYTSTSTSQEIISLGLDEPLPPQNVINELYVKSTVPHASFVFSSLCFAKGIPCISAGHFLFGTLSSDT
jgi:hypothetical protein